MFLLYAFETGDSLADGGGERLDVSGGAPNEGAEFGLHHLDEGWVLREESGGGGLVKVLCGQTRQYRDLWSRQATDFNIPSFKLERPGCWARDDIGAAVAGVFWGVLGERLAILTVFCCTALGGVDVGV